MSQHMSASGKMRSEQVVVEAPLSFAGSAKRIWKLTDQSNQWVRYGMMLLALFLIFMAWSFVAVWYMTWGLLLVPYRLLRRGSRRDKMHRLQHREQLEAMSDMQRQQMIATSAIIEQNNRQRNP